MYQKTPKGWLKHWDFILLELLCVQVSLVLAFFFRLQEWNLFANPMYRDIAVFLLIDDICVIYILETFKNILKRGPRREAIYAVRHTATLVLLVVLFLFFTKRAEPTSRLIIMYFGLIHLALSYGIRILWKHHLRRKMRHKGAKSLIIAATKETIAKEISIVRRHNYELYRISGLAIIDGDGSETEVEGIPVVSSFEDLPQFACHNWVDEILVVSPLHDEQVIDTVRKLSETGVTLHLALSEITHIDDRPQIMEQIAGQDVITTSLGYATVKQLFLKRVIDILGGLVGSIFTIILTVIFGPIILFSSPGGIFFTQERIGMNGKKFRMVKFRTMYKDAEERKKDLMDQNNIQDGMMFKMDFDPRIIGNKILPNGKHRTGIGQFLRNTSIDEFPQFFNVLIGQMSLVGTRPPTVDEWEKYQLHHRARMAAKPGITGMWQVSGRSEITDFEEVVKLDIKYIANWSLGLDIKIICKTIAVVLMRKGAK